MARPHLLRWKKKDSKSVRNNGKEVMGQGGGNERIGKINLKCESKEQKKKGRVTDS